MNNEEEKNIVIFVLYDLDETKIKLKNSEKND